MPFKGDTFPTEMKNGIQYGALIKFFTFLAGRLLERGPY